MRSELRSNMVRYSNGSVKILVNHHMIVGEMNQQEFMNFAEWVAMVAKDYDSTHTFNYEFPRQILPDDEQKQSQLPFGGW